MLIIDPVHEATLIFREAPFFFFSSSNLPFPVKCLDVLESAIFHVFNYLSLLVHHTVTKSSEEVSFKHVISSLSWRGRTFTGFGMTFTLFSHLVKVLCIKPSELVRQFYNDEARCLTTIFECDIFRQRLVRRREERNFTRMQVFIFWSQIWSFFNRNFYESKKQNDKWRQTSWEKAFIEFFFENTRC